MKILALSDIHSEERVVDRLPGLFAKHSPDMLIIAGDVADHGRVDFVEELLQACANETIFIIPGNMDDERVIERLKREEGYLDGRILRFRNTYNLFGIGGGNRSPFGTPNEYDDEDLWECLKDVDIPFPSIVVSHAPPKGYFDEVARGVHVGSEAVLRFMEKVRPFILVCGHIHEHQGHMEVEGTHLIKLGPAKDGNAALIRTHHQKREVSVEFIKMF